MEHFGRFGLEMHIGKRSKTKCVHFPAFENKYDEADTNQFAVQDGFVQFTKQFRYLGLVISFNLSSNTDMDARLSLATKEMGALRN